MSINEYPKEILEALERDVGIRFKGRHKPGGDDGRLCYGARCTWFGSIHEAKDKGIPVCPHCGGVLFEMQHEGEWWKGVDDYESQGHPGYRAMWEWQRAQPRCFENLAALTAAYSAVIKGVSK